MFGYVAAELVSDDSRLGAPEAGAYEDAVGVHLPVHERHAPGDHQF